MAEVLLNVDEMAARLGMSPITVRNKLRAGELPGFKMTPRAWRVSETELDEWIRAQDKAGRDAQAARRKARAAKDRAAAKRAARGAS